jgi:hypothetical protein
VAERWKINTRRELFPEIRQRRVCGIRFPNKFGRRSLAQSVNALAPEMYPLRFRIIVATVLVAMLGGLTAAFAADAHAACAQARHDCDDVPSIAECCCGDSGSSVPAPPEPRVQLGPTVVVAMPAVDGVVDVASEPASLYQVRTVSPRVCLLDLPTLFATLLI